MRKEEPRWRELLDLALEHFASIGGDRDEWVWGGGTVLMLRHQHRLSWDVDLFLDDPQMLGRLSPRLNDAVERSVHSYTEQANHLRCVVSGLGEIDYLLAGRVIDFSDEPIEIEGLGAFRSMPDREILAQKILYRGSRFAGRDLFDFAHVTHRRPEILEDQDLAKVARSLERALLARLEAPDLKQAYESIMPHPNALPTIGFEEARDQFRDWLRNGPAPTPASPG